MLAARRELGGRTLVRISDGRQLEVTQFWAEQGVLLFTQQVFFFPSVWFLSSRDNPFYLARQLNCFHFFKIQ